MSQDKRESGIEKDSIELGEDRKIQKETKKI